jgi:hypothetical protein
MKTSKILLLLVIVPAVALGQHEPGEQLDQVKSKEFLQQLIQDGVYFFIAPKAAESLVHTELNQFCHMETWWQECPARPQGDTGFQDCVVFESGTESSDRRQRALHCNPASDARVGR